MKLVYSGLLLLAAVSTCVAQSNTVSNQATPSLNPNPTAGIAGEEAMSRAANVAVAPANKEPGKMMDRMNQANCPVVLTSAGLTPYMMLLRTSGDAANNGGLDLELRNASGKEVRAMKVSAELFVKKSIYDLDSQRVQLHLTANGTVNMDKTLAQFLHLSLPQQILPTMVEKLTVEEVTFADGSIWTPATDSYCGLVPSPMVPMAR